MAVHFGCRWCRSGGSGPRCAPKMFASIYISHDDCFVLQPLWLVKKSAAEHHQCHRNTANALFIKHLVTVKCNSSSLLLKLADIKSRLVSAEKRKNYNNLDCSLEGEICVIPDTDVFWAIDTQDRNGITVMCVQSSNNLFIK